MIKSLTKNVPRVITAIALMTAVSTLQAALVDGISGAGEYDSGSTYDLGFATMTGESRGMESASLRYTVEAGIVYVLLSAPTDLVDNVYGAPSLLAGSGWDDRNNRGHKFKDLLNSENLEITIDADSGSGTVEFDYLTGDDQSGYEAVTLADPFSLILEVATSLQYNLSNGCGDSTDSAITGSCSEALSYEWSMLASNFTDGFSISNILTANMHVSPPKKPADEDFSPDCLVSDQCLGVTVTVPAPAGFWLALVGFIGLLGSRRLSDRRLAV